MPVNAEQLRAITTELVESPEFQETLRRILRDHQVEFQHQRLAMLKKRGPSYFISTEEQQWQQQESASATSPKITS